MIETKKQGFTIIEVVIVLVIGAVIMLMVFLVVPYLQRTQRDSRRQNDARRFLTAAEQWATNHQGNYPQTAADITDVVTNYIKDNFTSPNGNSYQTNDLDGVAAGAAASTTVNSSNEMVYRYGAQCSTSGTPSITALTGQNRKIAVLVFQENGQSFCVQN